MAAEAADKAVARQTARAKRPAAAPVVSLTTGTEQQPKISLPWAHKISNGLPAIPTSWEYPMASPKQEDPHNASDRTPLKSKAVQDPHSVEKQSPPQHNKQAGGHEQRDGGASPILKRKAVGSPPMSPAQPSLLPFNEAEGQKPNTLHGTSSISGAPPAKVAEEPSPFAGQLLSIMDQDGDAKEFIFTGNYGSIEDSLAVEHLSVGDLEHLEELQMRLASKILTWVLSIMDGANISAGQDCLCRTDEILSLLQMLPVTVGQMQALTFASGDKLLRTSPKLNCGIWDLFGRWESRKNKTGGGTTVRLSIRKSLRVKGSHFKMLGSWSLIEAQEGFFSPAQRPLMIMLAIRATFRLLNQPGCHVPSELATGLLLSLKGKIGEAPSVAAPLSS